MLNSPVQVNLNLGHDRGMDICDAWITETVEFDISRLREAYVAAFGEPDPIVVHVDDETILYNYPTE